jgi:hypothetical protein
MSIVLYQHLIEMVRLLTSPVTGVPQISRGIAQDMHKHIRVLGEFMNPAEKRYVLEFDLDGLSYIIPLVRYLLLELKPFFMAHVPVDDRELCTYCETLILIVNESLRMLLKKWDLK